MIWNFVKFNPCFFLRVQKRKKEIVLFERIQSISISAPSIAFLFSFIFLILYFSSCGFVLWGSQIVLSDSLSFNTTSESSTENGQNQINVNFHPKYEVLSLYLVFIYYADN